MPHTRPDRKAQRRKEAEERLANSQTYSDSRYKCNHLHTSPIQFQRCKTTRTNSAH